MAVKIGHARIDERGQISGGSAGDQTKNELCVQDWYAAGWNKMIRAKDSVVAERIAKAMEAACANDNIGYDQKERTSLYDQAKAKGWDISAITAECECDCSSLVAVCVNAAGVPVNKDMYTGNEARALKATGAFGVFYADSYITMDTFLMRGDILLKEGYHTAVVLSNGSAVKVKDEPVVDNGILKFTIGDIVNFTGSTHYTNSNYKGLGKSCKPGQAKVTAIAPKGLHPYHLVFVSGKGSNVWGWVNAHSVEAVDDPSENIQVGDIVTYSGTVHYTSSYLSATRKSCKGGKAEVTAIKRGNPHPYHLKAISGKGATVHGWVDEDKVKK